MTQRKQMIGFERFPLPARKTVFQGIAEKNDAFQDERCGFQTKRFKKCQKKFEKGIDFEIDKDDGSVKMVEKMDPDN